MRELYLKAPAKINLALSVKGIRDDGFHELEMIMQSISLADRVKLKKKSGSIILKTSHTELADDESNLAYQAAEIFFERNNLSQGVEIYLEKNIPIAAGMAGGSTDAAAVMRGLYELFELEADYEQIKSDLKKIGSDVPYCLEGGTVYASGKGDKLEQLPFIGEKYLVVVTPAFKISTPEVYKLYDKLKINSKFKFNSVLENLKNDKEIDWSLDYKNDLSKAAEKICPEIKEIKNIFKKTKAEITLLSGSGPTVFSIYNSRKRAEKVAADWPRKNDFVTAVKTIDKF